jgi:hypothetical protein
MNYDASTTLITSFNMIEMMKMIFSTQMTQMKQIYADFISENLCNSWLINQ